jgi:arginase
MLFLPWHLTDSLAGGLNVTLPDGTVQVEGAPGTTGDAWHDLIGVYAHLADEVAKDQGPTTVLSGDCVASLAVLAGVQRRGTSTSLVWFDAHGDFHTEETTTSGYLGGLPLAKAVGRGDLTLPNALGLASLAEETVTLVDARDLDPAEALALADSSVKWVSVEQLDIGQLPEGPVVIHVDVDIVGPSVLSGLRFPAPGGPHLEDVTNAVRAIAEARPLAALDIAATWRPADALRAQTDAVLLALLSL